MKLGNIPSRHTFFALPGSEEPTDLVGDCETLRSLRARLEQVASTTATVLLLGETGTGQGRRRPRGASGEPAS